MDITGQPASVRLTVGSRVFYTFLGVKGTVLAVSGDLAWVEWDAGCGIRTGIASLADLCAEPQEWTAQEILEREG